MFIQSGGVGVINVLGPGVNVKNMDYCSKVLYGSSVFYMLLSDLLEFNRPGLRTRDIFSLVAGLNFFSLLIKKLA
jgi:hypothetical protein